jgi:23S rRNA G2069 N7-methylase RlmK/C1962 C5-methylase RlmI
VQVGLEVKTMAVVALKKGRARPFWFGCPIVFSGAVETVEGEPAPGTLVEVRDQEGRVIGHGFFNADSTYRVRIVRLEQPGEPAPEVEAIVRQRLAQAARARAALGLPSGDTTAWRLVNSEGDSLSGLVVDVYGDLAVVQASARWVQACRGVVEAAVRETLGAATRIVHRASAGVRREEGLAAEAAADVEPVEVLERGLRYAVDARHGQKTGFFLDQRENRSRVRALSAGRRVLDAFCFTGGFALSAAAGGAAEVLGVDTSRPAIETATANAAANGLPNVRFEETDAMQVLASGRRWDVVVCDPPRLAAGRADLEAAAQRYKRLNRHAIGAVEPGGLLVTCSCSSVMRRDAFLEVVRDAATEAHRRVTVSQVLGAAPDHPVHPSWPEGEYLKCVIAVVS